ncbi:MAG: class I SAM-dependent methyltransferase [Parcubacteria group bacterium]|nr:class I SAM-dependent methyltransferase [Parcubacteria group bacterium]
MKPIIENRKKEEEKHYDTRAIKTSLFNMENGSSSMNPFLATPYVYAEDFIKENYQGKKVLDFGCGYGFFSIFPAKNGAKVIGIDISSESLKICNARSKMYGVSENIEFIKGDCESLPFESESFDLILSYGTMSCLNINNAYREMSRVLKPGGKVLIVDTLGYNPILNLNRWLKFKKGIRTKHTLEHILKIKDINLAKQYFGKTEEIKYFDITTVFLAFFTENRRRWLWLFKVLLKIDKIILSLPFVKYLAFKVVFVLSGPKK